MAADKREHITLRDAILGLATGVVKRPKHIFLLLLWLRTVLAGTKAIPIHYSVLEANMEDDLF